jgi:hypothetical protein
MVPGALRSPAFAATTAGAAGMPTMAQLWDWEHQLVETGTRYTASPGHIRYVEWLAEQFGRVPGLTLRSDRLTFNRWLAQDWSLSVEQPSTAGPSGPVPVTYYYPYSGTTPAAGVTGKLVDLGTYAPAVPGTSGTGYLPELWDAAKGAIALVRTLPPTFPLSPLAAADGGYEPGRSSAQAAADYNLQNALVTNPALQGIFGPVPLLDARNAGVLAVVCVWTGVPDDEVVNQYNPFITPYPTASGLPTPGDPGCPAVWVGDATGAQLSRWAATGQATATVTLTADITAGAATETLWGVLPGGSDAGESLIVNTHTDGPNATEENGGLGMLALAQHFAALPSRRRDLYFVLVTGHFQLPQFTKTIPDARPEVGSDATSVWLLDHPGITSTAVAGVTVEHLGCTRWVDDPVTGGYVPTGGYEWGATYTAPREASLSATNTEQQAYLAAVAGRNAAGQFDYPVATLLPDPVYLGEGAPLYAAGLGTVSLCPAPTYLLQAGDAQRPQLLDLDKLDQQLMYHQVQVLADTIAALDAAATTSL